MQSHAAGEAKADAVRMQAALQGGLEKLSLSEAEARHFWEHMHFATSSVEATGHWVPALLDQWTSPRNIITVATHPGTAANHGVTASTD